MKKLLQCIFIAVLSLNSYAQIVFEKGYYVSNTNEKVEGLIKNLDWKNNPTEFEFRTTEGSETQIQTIKMVKEFGINNVSKYTRQTVNIDRSENFINKLSSVRSAIFKEEELFLKVLIEGKANLYAFEDGSILRYFYNKDESKIEQLVFKKYLIRVSNIGTNERYKQQLLNDLTCPSIQLSKVENLDYNKNQLMDFFIDYNNCNNEESINYEKKQKKDLFNLSLRPGMTNASLALEFKSSLFGFDNFEFDNQSSVRFGIEAEFVLGFNKNKWAFIIEPTYQQFKAEKQFENENIEVNYTSIEVPIGIRHYFFINENSKIFINGSFIFDFSGNSVINLDYGSFQRELELDTVTNLAFGLGYKYNDTYSLEFRFQTGRELLNNTARWTSDYKTMAIIFGYTLF